MIVGSSLAFVGANEIVRSVCLVGPVADLVSGWHSPPTCVACTASLVVLAVRPHFYGYPDN